MYTYLHPSTLRTISYPQYSMLLLGLDRRLLCIVMFYYSSREDKQKMLELLKRLEEQSDNDAGCGLDVNSDPTVSLEERLAGLDLGR